MYLFHTTNIIYFLYRNEEPGLLNTKRIGVALVSTGNPLGGLQERLNNGRHFMKWTSRLCKYTDTCRLLCSKLYCLLSQFSEDCACGEEQI